MTNGTTGVSAQQWQSAQAGAARARSNAVVACNAPRIAVNWTAHDFGRIRKGSAPPHKELVVTSTGGRDLVISSIQVDSSEFKFDPAATTTLPPGASTTLVVRFEPTAFGPQNGMLQIASNAINTDPVVISVGGRLFSVLTVRIVDKATGDPRSGVHMKLQQSGQAGIEAVTDDDGFIIVETETEGAFSVNEAGHEEALEYVEISSG